MSSCRGLVLIGYGGSRLLLVGQLVSDSLSGRLLVVWCVLHLGLCCCGS